MTYLRKLVLLFFILNLNSLTGQTPDNSNSLRQVFDIIEQQYSCVFAYKDVDITNHFSQVPEAESLSEAVDWLSSNTLFDFTILEDNTVAVSLKTNLFMGCINVLKFESGSAFENVAVRTPYQQLGTDSNGVISFLYRGASEEIIVSHTGYEQKAINTAELPSTGCLSTVLYRKIEFLNTVTLVNYLARGITKNANGSITVDYDEFDIVPGLIEPDVLQTIQALPGIQSVNEQVSYINIRGGTNDQNLILWDGIKMYQSGHFFGLISAFNPFLTKKVTVIKNGSSAEFGDGVSGIISMEGDNEINTDISGGWGINLISTDAFLDLPLGNKASLQVAGRKSFNNLLETPTYTSYFDQAFQNTEVVSNNEIQMASNDDFTFYDSHLRFQYKPTFKDKLRLNLLFLGNKLEFLETAVVDGERQSLQSELGQDNISAGINYKRQWSEYFNSEIQFYATQYELQATNFDILNAQRLLQTNELLESGIKVMGRFSITENSNVMAGYQFNETGITNFEQINNPFFEITDEQVLRTQSVFSEFKMRTPTKNTTFVAGLRLNQIEKFDEILLEPRFSINHRFWSYFSVDIAGELKSQTTSQIIDFQNDFLGVENRRWVLSSPGRIPILKGQQFSAGVNYSRDGWLVNFESYVKKITGITTQSQGFQNQFESTRTHGEYFVTGIDILLDKRFHNINTWLSYSYAENNYTFEELEPSDFPNNIDIRHSFTYGITYAPNQFKVSAGLNWRSGKPITNLVQGMEIVNGDLNFDSPNDSNIADYLRIDLSGTYTFNIGRKIEAFAGLSFWNLLHTTNQLNYFFRIDNNNKAEKMGEHALSFTPNATFRLSF